MRSVALLGLIVFAVTCGPSPDAKLPGYLGGPTGAGGATPSGTGGVTGSGGSITGNGGSPGTGGASVGGSTGGLGTGGKVGTGGVSSSGGAAGTGGRIAGAGGSGATCTDGIKNQDETDVDCGGAACPARCTASKACSYTTDCDRSGVPALICVVATMKCTDPCTDKVQDGDETGVDCGGTCPLKCIGDPCIANADCQSTICDTTAGTCKGPDHPLGNIKQACWDGITGYNSGDKTSAMSKIVPCMITNMCCKAAVPTCIETCFTSNDGVCGVNKTSVGTAPHDFIVAYYKNCVP